MKKSKYGRALILSIVTVLAMAGVSLVSGSANKAVAEELNNNSDYGFLSTEISVHPGEQYSLRAAGDPGDSAYACTTGYQGDGTWLEKNVEVVSGPKHGSLQTSGQYQNTKYVANEGAPYADDTDDTFQLKLTLSLNCGLSINNGEVTQYHKGDQITVTYHVDILAPAEELTYNMTSLTGQSKALQMPEMKNNPDNYYYWDPVLVGDLTAGTLKNVVIGGTSAGTYNSPRYISPDQPGTYTFVLDYYSGAGGHGHQDYGAYPEYRVHYNVRVEAASHPVPSYDDVIASEKNISDAYNNAYSVVNSLTELSQDEQNAFHNEMMAVDTKAIWGATDTAEHLQHAESQVLAKLQALQDKYQKLNDEHAQNNKPGQPGNENIVPPAKPSEKPSEPSSKPSEEPSEEPSAEPSAKPSEEPSVEPSAKPSEEPSAEPSAKPSEEPSEQPSAEPSAKPSETERPAGDRPSDQPAANGASAGDTPSQSGSQSGDGAVVIDASQSGRSALKQTVVADGDVQFSEPEEVKDWESRGTDFTRVISRAPEAGKAWLASVHFAANGAPAGSYDFDVSYRQGSETKYVVTYTAVVESEKDVVPTTEPSEKPSAEPSETEKPTGDSPSDQPAANGASTGEEQARSESDNASEQSAAETPNALSSTGVSIGAFVAVALLLAVIGIVVVTTVRRQRTQQR